MPAKRNSTDAHSLIFIAFILLFLLILLIVALVIIFAYMLTQKDPKTGDTPSIILKMRKYVLLALGVTTLLIISFDFYRVPRLVEYGVIGVVGLLIGTYWLRRNAGTTDIRKLHFDTDESFVLPHSFARTCKVIPTVVTGNHWKLVESNEDSGVFQIKIGMSRKTWGEIMVVDVTQVNAKSSKVNVRCSAQHQIYDYGKNYADITKFHTALLKELDSGRKEKADNQ